MLCDPQLSALAAPYQLIGLDAADTHSLWILGACRRSRKTPVLGGLELKIKRILTSLIICQIFFYMNQPSILLSMQDHL